MTAEPAEGMIIMVAVYVPANIPILTAKVSIELAPASSLPVAGATINQGCDGELTAYVSTPPPVFVSVIICPGGFAPPAIAVKVSVLGLTCITGGALTGGVLPS